MTVGHIPASAIIGFARDIEAIADRKELARILRMVRAIDDEAVTAARNRDQASPARD